MARPRARALVAACLAALCAAALLPAGVGAAGGKTTNKALERDFAAKRRECERAAGVNDRCRAEQIDTENCILQ
jgi:hypothetical protein